MEKSNRLMLMTDFIIRLEETNGGLGEKEYTDIWNYTLFLKQPLALWMFVPCDENNVPLEFIEYETWTGSDEEYNKCTHEYFEAQSRVLFEGFYKEFNAVMSPQGGYLDVEGLKHKTIETIIGSDLTLTETAIKQIYGS